ncbi:MAG TPA: lysophospholipid acyltransferase family protein [Dehalococcoidales bacterium]|nr:lysophospholipid acyltransferase family protein [Dehalococcoidales bacterium]
MHFIYHLGRFLIHPVVFPFASWKVVGKENIEGPGPYLIACNHLHIADPPIVAASLPLKAFFMAKEDLWNNAWSRYWVENFGAFPVSRNGSSIEAVRRGEECLKKGYSLIIFPEGGRSRDGLLQPALQGAALIAMRTGVPVLPVGVRGTYNFRDLKYCFFHRQRVVINIGQPFQPAWDAKKPAKEQRQALTDAIMRKIAALVPPGQRGAYGEK